MGLYRNGNDLGSSIEFRSRLEIAYRVADRSRIGLAISHVSNAGIEGDNPGTNSVSAYCSVPLAAMAGR